MSALTDFENAKAEYQKLVSEKGQAVIDELVKGVFEAHPEVEAIRWQQYTPYFNDGEPCVFGLNRLGFKITGTSDTAGDYEDGFWDTWALGSDNDSYGGKRPELAKALSSFKGRLEGVKDVLLATFRDGYEVIATRDGFEVEECSHE